MIELLKAILFGIVLSIRTIFLQAFAIPFKHIAKRLRERIGNITPTVSPPSFALTSLAISSIDAQLPCALATMDSVIEITSLSRSSKPSYSAASKTLSATILARSSPSRIIGQRIPLETVPTLLSLISATLIPSIFKKFLTYQKTPIYYIIILSFFQQKILQQYVFCKIFL